MSASSDPNGAANTAGDPAMADPNAFTLDVKSKKRGMWLVKIPTQELADAVDFALDNEELGELWKFSTGNSSKRKAAAFDLKINDNIHQRFEARPSRPGAEIGKRGKLMKHFKLDSKDDKPAISVFTETKLRGNITTAVELRGHINTEATLNSDITKNYSEIASRFKQKSQAAANVPEAKEVDSRKLGHTYNPNANHMKDARKDQRDAKEKKKHDGAAISSYGITDDEIKQRIFKLFEQFEFWAFADLTKKLKLPQEKIKRVLNEIAEYLQSGPHKARWKLKAVYSAH